MIIFLYCHLIYALSVFHVTHRPIHIHVQEFTEPRQTAWHQHAMTDHMKQAHPKFIWYTVGTSQHSSQMSHLQWDVKACQLITFLYIFLHFFSITHTNVMSSFKFFFSLPNMMDTQMNSKFCHSFFALLKCCINCLSNRCMWSYTSKPAWPACHWLIWRYQRGTPLSFVSKIYSTLSTLGTQRRRKGQQKESRGIMQVPG